MVCPGHHPTFDAFDSAGGKFPQGGRWHLVRHGSHRGPRISSVCTRPRGWPNGYVLARFHATCVFDESDQLLAILAIQLHEEGSFRQFALHSSSFFSAVQEIKDLRPLRRPGSEARA